MESEIPESWSGVALSAFHAYLNELSDAVVAGNTQKARRLTERLVNEGVPADDLLNKMMEAMRIVDKKYERKEYFAVDVAAASTAMKEALKVLEPHLAVKPTSRRGKVIIGSLKGNIQGLGKDIVAATLRSAGFHVVDLGVDVSPEAFVESAIRQKAEIIAISVSVNETVPHLKEIAKLQQERKLKGTVKTIIGGRAVSEEVAKKYGIDAYAKDQWECVKKIRQLLEQ